MTDTPKDPNIEVDKETLKDLEANEAEDVKGGASGMNNCKPLTESIASPDSGLNTDLNT